MGILDRLADAVADRVKASMPQLPAGAIATDVAAMVNSGALEQSRVQQATSVLPLDEALYQQPFGPNLPARPQSLGPMRDDGRSWPRRSEYDVSWNQPGLGLPLVPWRVLRQFADHVDIARRCIEVRKTQIASLDWDITVDDAALMKYAQDEEGSTLASARKRAQDDMGETIARLRDFWKTPDRLNGLDFDDWLGMLLEDHFVLDAVTVYPHRTMDGTELHSLELLDGSTIKPLLDARGATPQPPNPAYQQVLHGFPRGDYIAAWNAADEFSLDELIYRPRYRRTFTPYGYSNTEQCLVAGNIYLKRQEWIRTEYDGGTSPRTWMQTDSDMQPSQIVQWEEVLNGMLMGSTQERHRIKILPKGFTPDQMTDVAERYTPDYDEHLIRLICAMYDVQPIEIGFTPKSGLGGKGFGEHQDNVTYRKAIRPTLSWLKQIINTINRKYLGAPPELTFKFFGFEVEDEESIEQNRDSETRGGRRTINEGRVDMGMPLFPHKKADVPFVVVGGTLVWLDDESQDKQNAKDAQPTGAVQIDPLTGKPVPGVTPPQLAAHAIPSKQLPAADTSAKPQDVSDELKKFESFASRRIRSGHWRDFEFAHIAKSVGDDLNELGSRGELAALRQLARDVAAVPRPSVVKRRWSWREALADTNAPT